jgi:Acyltransferase
MSGADEPEVAKWDPGFTRQIKNWVGPIIKRYFRAEVRNLDAIPAAGGALVVSNHSGGMFTPDVLIFAPAFYEKFGFDRPVYTLAHYGVFLGPLGDLLRRAGVIEASRENAAKALHSGAVVLVFPGGDYDSYRPTLTENVIDFNGRRGYVRTAIETGVPIVPMVVDRRAGDPIVFGARRFDRAAVGSHPGQDGDPAPQRRGFRSASARSSRRTCRCRPRSSPVCSIRSTSQRSSARIPMSRRLTSTSGR